MNIELIKLFAETIEHSSQVCKLFVNSEIALNDGDTNLSVKFNKEAQQLFETMSKDVFVEVKDMLNVTTDDVLDYDYPSVLELSKVLCDLSYNLSRYINMDIENQNTAIDIVSKKIIVDLNTACELYNMLFNN